MTQFSTKNLSQIPVVSPVNTLHLIGFDANNNDAAVLMNAAAIAAFLGYNPAAGRLNRSPQILTSGTSYTTNPGTTTIIVEAMAGGGGGGGAATAASSAAAGGGGNAGAYAMQTFSVAPNTAYAYAIGAGGSSGSNAGGDGGAGGDTTFTVGGTTLTANGGGGGRGMTGGTTNLFTDHPARSSSPSGDLYMLPGNGSPGIRLSGTVAMSGAGGSQRYANGAPYALAAGNGPNGFTGGGGGGGLVLNGSSAVVGGQGGNGLIVVWEYT